MTRYIYIDESYKNAYLRNSSPEQRITMNAVATFMAAPDTENEKGIGKKLIVKGVSKEEFKAFSQESGKESYENKEYENWMNYIIMACSQGDAAIVEFDGEEGKDGDVNFFDILVNDNDKSDIAKLNSTYWLSHCLCDKSVDECKKLERKYGISFIGIDQDVTKAEPEANFLVQDKDYHWGRLIGERAGNSFFVLDRYAFNPEKMLMANIIPILKKLICTGLETPITVYTMHDYAQISNLETKISSELQGINNDVKINVLVTGETFHDRIIVANNMYITIGGGFDALSENIYADGTQKSRKNTTLHIYSNPAISSKNWLRNEYFGYVNAISKKYDALNQTAIHKNQHALMTNRLVRPAAEIESAKNTKP